MEDLTGLGNLAQLETELRRLTDRLRSLSAPRLAAEAPPYRTRADAARNLAQALADATQGIASAQAADAPRWRKLPKLSDFAVGDMVAVTGRDLVHAAAGVAPDQEVWTLTGRRAAGEVLTEVLALLTEVRRLV